MNLKEEFKEFIKRNKLNLNGKNIVVGVSCGVDSISLLHLLEENEKEMGYKIIVCHVNHKRRAQSEIEEEYIKDYCKDKHTIHVLHFEESKEHIASFQEMARNKRLEFFKNVIKEEKGDFLFLAHHLNDDMETTFMHLIRGSSLESIVGMKEVTYSKDIIIVRPFLRVLKKDIYEYANSNNYKYFEDCTNSTNDYTRNRIRHNLINVLFEENPNFNNNYLLFKEKMEYSVKLMNDLRDNIINKSINKENDGKGYKISFYKEDLFMNDIIMVKEVLFEVLKCFNFSNNNINEIIKIINTNKTQLIVNYKQICIIKEYDKIIITNDLYNKKVFNLIIDKIGLYHLNNDYDLNVSMLDNEKKSRNTISNIDIIWYNSNKFPFLVRNRKEGDKILLSIGHKKIKDLLIDEHISLKDRNNVLLLEDKNNDIISVLGIKKSSILSNEKENDIQIELIRRDK